jgi:hypothetical protein
LQHQLLYKFLHHQIDVNAEKDDTEVVATNCHVPFVIRRSLCLSADNNAIVTTGQATRNGLSLYCAARGWTRAYDCICITTQVFLRHMLKAVTLF